MTNPTERPEERDWQKEELASAYKEIERLGSEAVHLEAEVKELREENARLESMLADAAKIHGRQASRIKQMEEALREIAANKDAKLQDWHVDVARMTLAALSPSDTEEEA